MTASSVIKLPVYFSKSVKITAKLFIGLYLVIWAISSPLSQNFLKPLLIEQRLTLCPDTSIRLTLFHWLFDKIVISKFQLDNAHIKINKTATQLVITGIDLNKENPNESPNKNQEYITGN